MAKSRTQRLCIYRGRVVGRVKKCEHFVSEAIIGAVTIKAVCGECINSFSQIDTELMKGAFRSPNTNAFVARFIQSIERECLDQFVIFGNSI